MRRDQVEHAIRAACQIIGRSEVIVVGSQAILGTFRGDELPHDATMSMEVDILPISDDADEVERLADQIEGVAGEDLCVAKLCAFREKDRNFVGALLQANLVDAGVIAERLVTVDDRYRAAIEPAVRWVAEAGR